MGICTPGKMQRILASQLFLQHAKLNMAGFVLYLLGGFALRYKMVELHPKNKKKHSAVSQNHYQDQDPLTTKDTKDTKEDEGLQPVIPLKPTPFWDDLG